MPKEMHRVKRAVIMAAGLGKRHRPVTLTVPKPLVRVSNVRMIDTILMGLRENGIEEIYIVVGHLKEAFEEASKEWPGVTLIENPWYDVCNNISSLYVAREHLEECMILDGDQIIRDARVLAPEFAYSGYNATRCEGETDEWLMQAEGEELFVTSCGRNGGADGWQLYSISRWSAEDGRKLSALVKKEFEAGNRQIYWDDVPMFAHPEEFRLAVYPMEAGAVVEVDNLGELIALDPTYQAYDGGMTK